MNRNKYAMAGGILAVALLISAGIEFGNKTKEYEAQLMKQKEQIESLQEQYVQNINKYEAETEAMLKQLEEQASEINSLTEKNQELQAENDSLEGVQQSIIDNVGYIPSEYELKLLERLVEAEAGIESIEGKIAVVNVVLNRIQSDSFPDGIHEVIYQSGQFEPAMTGAIDLVTVSEDSKEAVKRAFRGEKMVASDILYFWANYVESGHEIWSCVEAVHLIGTHYFGR